MDTLEVDREKCFRLTFVPNNSQDFGFTGELYILADSTFRVHKCRLKLPKKSDINFVDNMIIDQKFGALPSGEWVLKEDDMLCELSYLRKILGSFQVRRTTRYSDFGFEEISDRIFKKKGDEIKDVNAMMRDESFWKDYRPEQLTKSEDNMSNFVENLSQIRGFKYIMFVLRAFIENFVETGVKGTPQQSGPRSHQHDDFEHLHRRAALERLSADHRQSESALVLQRILCLRIQRQKVEIQGRGGVCL